jgi:F-type H+-transporting ATPase subunit delta
MAWEGGNLPEWSDQLRLLAAVVADPAMKAVIADPRVPKGKLADLVLSVGGDLFAPPMRNLVQVLAENQRLSLTQTIVSMFEEERARAQRQEKVTVLSAYPLEAAHEEAIARAMRARLGCDVAIDTSVDPSLIGGVVIRAGDRVIDASIRGRLGQLAAALA